MNNLKLIAIEPWWQMCLGLFNDGTVRKIKLYDERKQHICRVLSYCGDK